MSGDVKVCAACDCVIDEYFQTAAGAGPFCAECWQSLTDPDQSLLLEKRVAAYEVEAERFKELLTMAANQLEERVFINKYTNLDTKKLIEELREVIR